GGDGGASGRQRLDDQRRFHSPETGPTDIVTNIDTTHAKRAGLADRIDRKMLVLVPLQRERRNFVVGEVLGHLPDSDLLLVEGKIHVLSSLAFQPSSNPDFAQARAMRQ